MSRKYRKEWEEDPLFQPWLCNDPTNIIRAYCKVCGLSITPKKDILRSHSTCKTHIQNIELFPLLSEHIRMQITKKPIFVSGYAFKNATILNLLTSVVILKVSIPTMFRIKKTIGENVLIDQKMYENNADNDINDAKYFSKQLCFHNLSDDNYHSFNRDININVVSDDSNKYMHIFRPD